MELLLIPIALIVVAAVTLFFMMRVLRSKKLSSRDVQMLRQEWQKAAAQSDPHRRVMDGEKVLDHALRALGYNGTFAEKFTKAQVRVKNAEAVWSAHRLRNRLAHEMSVELRKGEAERAVEAFEKALKSLGA